MKSSRILMFVLLLVATGAMLSFGQWRWWIGSYPEVDSTPLDKLAYWLVLVDLESQDDKIKDDLVNRFQHELDRGWSPFGKASESLDDSTQSLLERNIDELTRHWFYTRSFEFHHLPDKEQVVFLGVQLTSVLSWVDIHRQVYARRPSETGEVASQFALFDQIDQWVMEADKGQQPDLQQSMHCAVLYWLCTEDLLKQDIKMRQELAERLAAAFAGDVGGSGINLELKLGHQERLQSNAFALVEVWLLSRAVEYVKLPQGQRESYLDAQVGTVMSWELDKVLLQNNPTQASTADSIAQLTKLLGSLTVWADRAPLPHRAAYQLLARELQVYAVKKLLNL
ncbi:MAG: hypothetical protein HOB29_08755 [Planctomycetaceae bacterium]|nr:hypothetical protein [Planctomycetaceae bacterium]MBT5123048.1 hypothetical protein [Planctomycetaceae bacterium]MBT7257271.1 hypothetical protein [Planctomycetaceae bacterium]